jgi:hypothetical protein
VDEISDRKGHRYLLYVVDHDTGRLVRAAKGRDSAVLRRFFDALGEDRSDPHLRRRCGVDPHRGRSRLWCASPEADSARPAQTTMKTHGYNRRPPIPNK